MLEGRDFTIFTDHKPLTYALFMVSPPWSACLPPHLSYLAKFTCSLVHIPGLENIVADPLSRPSPALSPASAPVPTSAPALASPSLSSASALVSLSIPLPCSVEPVISGCFDISLLPSLQLNCPCVSEMKSSPSLSVVFFRLGAKVLQCDSAIRSLQPLVPLQLWRQVFKPTP